MYCTRERELSLSVIDSSEDGSIPDETESQEFAAWGISDSGGESSTRPNVPAFSPYGLKNGYDENSLKG